jgi:hypothetical protein
MSSPVLVFRPSRGVSEVDPAQARERWERRWVALAWGLLILNVLTFYPRTWSGLPLLVPIPPVIGKALTQGSLPAALLVALIVNRRAAIRPNVLLSLVSLLVVEAVLTSMQAHYVIGTAYRTFRLTEFVAVLWLLTPWWGRRDLLLVRSYLAAMSIVLGSVLLGLLAAPGHALAEGRLSGTLWPTPPTQIAHFAAVTTGLVIVLWLSGLMRGRITLFAVPVTAAMLLLTHTRTALIAMLAGIFVGGLSLFMIRARVRKLFVATGIAVSIAAITLSSVVTTWLARGENGQQLTGLTGRTSVWSVVLSVPRNWFQMIFGFGLSNQGVNGLAIDSNWLAAYYDQGIFAIVVCAAMLLFLLVAAYFQPRGPQRALALFLVTYCLVASFTETGFSQPSTYLLELTLAASLLVQSAAVPGEPTGASP